MYNNHFEQLLSDQDTEVQEIVIAAGKNIKLKIFN